MSNNVNIINNAGKDVVVTVNQVNGGTQIVIDLAGNKVQLSSLKPGSVFKGNDGEECILWYFTENGNAAIIRRELLDKEMKFGANNNFNGSYFDNYLNDTYLKVVEKNFGSENIVEHDVDLLSLDGYDDYGIIRRKISIPTIDQYRHNRKTIGKNMKKSWPLATPDSTPSGFSSDGVQCVHSDGSVYCNWCGSEWAVRPFFILKSDIFVSYENVSA